MLKAHHIAAFGILTASLSAKIEADGDTNDDNKEQTIITKDMAGKR